MEMADPEGPEAAVRRVLPSLNFAPDSLPDLESFIARARWRAHPSARALNGVENVLVFLGTIETPPEAFAAEAGGRGLAALTDPTRAACRRLLVAWEDRAGQGAAMTFALETSGDVGPPIGASWIRPENWQRPMTDATIPPERRIDAAMQSVRGLIALNPRPADFEERMRRALDVLDTALRSLGGEGQRLRDRRGSIEVSKDWKLWLDDLEHSVFDEERRVTGAKAPEIAGDAIPTATGPLSGLRVFLSYARPDAATLARPVDRALRQAGAEVWFDQEQEPDKILLDEGLAAQISDRDAFLMCASDEYVERAGYATQELAWAMEQPAAPRGARRFAAAARPGTVLPSIVLPWPLVGVDDSDQESLADRLAAALTVEPIVSPTAPPVRSYGPPPPLALQADIDAIRRRRRHVQRFLEITTDDALALAASDAKDLRANETKERLMSLGRGLDWDGTLAGIEDWPEDPLVRACRWDLASLRVLASLRWPLSGDLKKPDFIAPDLERILTRRNPIVDLPTFCGWADNERRLFLRRQAGLLRALEEMLVRGLYGGLIAEHIRTATIDEWTGATTDRRRETHDFLIEMRVAGAISWRGESATWDHIYKSVVEVLRSQNLWNSPVPQEVLMALSGNTEDIAAMAGDVVWMARHDANLARQMLNVPIWSPPFRIEVWCACGAVRAPRPEPGESVQLSWGLERESRGPPALALEWRGFGHARTTGAARGPAPAAFYRIFSSMA